MKNKTIEPNRDQTNGQVHAKFATSPAVANLITQPRNEPAGNGPTVLPLPKGEGRGEGEQHLQTTPRIQLGETPCSANPRNGKVARLPEDIREQVNHMLRVGLRYIDILACLKEQGHSDLTEVNICNWKHGGYIDWLQREQADEARAALPRALEHCTHAVSIDRLHQNVVGLACDQLNRIMLKFDADRALDALYEKPQLFPAFIGAIASLARCTADLAKAFDLAQNRESKIREQIQSSSAGQPDANSDVSPSHERVENLTEPKPALGEI